MTNIIAIENVEVTTCDMCAYGMKSSDEQGEAPAQKRTKLMSSCHEIIKRVSAQCTNKTAEHDHDKHRHVQLIGGRAKACQVYPRMFSRAVCEGLAAQKRLINLGLHSQPLMTVDEITAAVKKAEMGTSADTGDPSKDLHEDEGIVAFDDQSGAPLKPSMVAAARKDEIKYFR